MTDTPNNTSPSPEAKELLRLWVQDHKAALEVLLDSYCLVDPLGVVVDFNVAFTELCGESYRKVLKIGNFSQLITLKPASGPDPLTQVLTQKKSLRVDELIGATKAYPELNVIFSAAPLIHKDGRFIGALVTIRNVSAENELQKKYDERKRESITDGLTRLYNKIYTETTLLRMMKMVLRDELALSIVMCDIDHFKKVNDTYGHQAGDYILANVAQLMVEEARETDVVGRFGGEEFMAILSNTGTPGAKIFCERFRSRIAGTVFEFDGKKIPVTVSLGTCSFKETWKTGLNPEEELKKLIHHADIALYFAKANGRNQTSQFESLTAEQQAGGVPKKKASA